MRTFHKKIIEKKCRLLNTLEYPFLSKSTKIQTCSKLPSGRLCAELLDKAFLGFRKHSILRYIHLYSHYTNEVRSVNSSLSKYLKKISLPHLLLLFQIYSRNGTIGHETSLLYIELLSQHISSELIKVSELDVINERTINGESGFVRKNTSLDRWQLYKFIFQHKSSLIKSRNNNSKPSLPEAESNFDTQADLHDANQISCGATSESLVEETKEVGTTRGHTTFDNSNSSAPLDFSNVFLHGGISSPQYSALDCTISDGKGSVLSSTLMCVILSSIYCIRNWEHGYPFDSWINQYYIQNCHLYHPLLLRLFAMNILPFYDIKRDFDLEFEALYKTLRNDLISINVPEYQNESWLFGTYHPVDGFYELLCRQYDFQWNDFIEIFSIVKKIAHDSTNDNNASQLLSSLVKLISSLVDDKPFNMRGLNNLISICNRNDSVNGLEMLLESVEAKILSNLGEVTPLDLCNLLQALYKNNVHSQDLIDALSYKLNSSDLNTLSLSCISQCIQTLGRMQASFKDSSFLDKIANYLLENDKVLKTTSEAYCSAFLWGFYKLHYKHPPLLSLFCKRYTIKKRDSPNVNSLVISLTALSRLESFEDASIIVEIYKLVLKSISTMTIMTSQQLMTSITRLLESVPLNCSDEALLKTFYTSSNKLVNACMKHVCERQLDQLNTTQAGAMLNSLYRLRYRNDDIIAPLIASITGFKPPKTMTRKDWGKNTPHAPRKNIFSYHSLPPCPFNVDECRKRLENIEATHLVGICEAIYGLDFWSPYSLHLMLQIKSVIGPQLHDMKATHILAVAISFTDWYFTDYQLNSFHFPVPPNQFKFKKTEEEERRDLYRKMENIVYEDEKFLHIKRSTWFKGAKNGELLKETCDESSSQTEICLNKFRNLLNRSKWKEELLLGCVEGLQRHLSFLSASSTPLKRAKVLFDSLRFDVYLNEYPDRITLLQQDNDFMNSAPDKCPFLLLEHSIRQPINMYAVIPQNIIESQMQLYQISRTESYYNFIHDSGRSEVFDEEGDEESKEEVDDEKNFDDPTPSTSLNCKNDKPVPSIRPIYGCIKIDDSDEKIDEILSIASYTNHKSAGAILKVNAVDNTWIYVDPTIGGYRVNILILDGNKHYVPHLNQRIYT